MRATIVTAGTRGDVDPYTGLAACLAGAGHEITVATHECFRELVGSAGVGFSSLPGDPRALLGSEAFHRWQDSGKSLRAPRQAGRSTGVMAKMSEFWEEVGLGIVELFDEPGDVLLVANPVAPITYHLAVEHNVPSMGVYWGPLHPTRSFPPMFGGGRSLGAVGNRLSGSLVRAVVESAYSRAILAQRRRLGLPPAGPAAQRRQQDRTRWPILHGVSPAVLPRPSDWRPGLDVVGYWWPRPPAGWRPEPELMSFIDGGPAPVFVGFGSVAIDDADRLSDLAVTAARSAGLRLVLQSGWAELSASDDDVLVVGDVPYEWLFPRMRAVVQRAGAGTMAAAFRAGIPIVSTPRMIDQYFWSARATSLGVGPAPVPFHELEAGRLADAIRAAVANPAFSANAARVAAAIAREDGAGRVLNQLERSGAPA